MTDERWSIIALFVGMAVASALAVAFDLGPGDSVLVAIVGAGIGYAIRRGFRPTRRGPPKYWRGRAYRD